MHGPGLFLSQSDRPASAWLDADRVRLDPVNDLGVVRAIDTRGGAEQIVFIAPPPPVVKAEGDFDSFELSGDLRWAIFQRWDAGGALLRQELFDVQRGVIAEVERPWGFIQQWSPDASYVVLSRSTFHAPASKLAKFEFQ